MKEFIMAGTLITNGLLVSGSSAYFESFDRIYKTSVPDPVNPVRLEVYDNGPLDLSDELVNQAANITAMSGSITLTTGAGNDTLTGNGDDDTLNGGAGRDILRGLDGNDSLNGGLGDDDLLGGNGLDTLAGNDGNDVLDSGGADDTLFGGDGADRLLGAGGNDSLNGGIGSDRLQSGAGADFLTGGTGANEFWFEAAGGSDRITDFQNHIDNIYFDAALWGGASKTASQILAYASVVSGNTVFNFGNGNTLTVAGVTDKSILLDDIGAVTSAIMI